MRKRLTSREPIWSITRINREQSPFPDDNNVHPEFGKKWAIKATRPTTGTRAKYLDYLCAEKSNKFQTTTTTSTGNDGESVSESENGRHLRALFDLFCFALSNVRMRMRTIDTTRRPIALYGASCEITRHYDSNLNSTGGTDELVTSSNHDHGDSGAAASSLQPSERTRQFLLSIATAIIARFIIAM